MSYGYMGKILRIDLTQGKAAAEEPSDKFYRKYIGGPGIGAYYLLNEMKAGIDPLGPDNILVFTAGILTGTVGPAVPRYTVMAKSPLTGAIGKSEAGGFWGPMLKRAGFDAVVIEGKSPEPVYIFINDNIVEIRSASNLWGKTTKECQEIIKGELGSNVCVAQIGPGGENLVRYANICNDLTHFNGRNGLGAVMGSKNLKAIAVNGTGKVSCNNEEQVREIARYTAKTMKDNPLSWGLHVTGTPIGIGGNNAAGVLPTENWAKSVFDGAEKIGTDSMEKIELKPDGCYACPIRCKRVVEVKTESLQVDPDLGGPEYETLAALGSNLGIDDLNLISKANELCNKYTIDTISTGMTISFAMECFEKGLLTLEDTGGMRLTFGNSEVLLPIIEKIAFRKDFGYILAEGSARMAEKMGKSVQKFLLSVKGQEIPMHDPRFKTGLGLQYALSDTGAEHWTAQHDQLYSTPDSFSLKSLEPLGIHEAVETTDISYRKVRAFYYTHLMVMMFETLGFCSFGLAPRSVLPVQKLFDLVRAVTGWDTSMWELMKAGERVSNMLRSFNVREGFGRNDDILPDRMFEPIANGPKAGKCVLDRDAFNNAVGIYYQMAGWDVEGKPLPGKLYELDIGWVIGK